MVIQIDFFQGFFFLVLLTNGVVHFICFFFYSSEPFVVLYFPFLQWTKHFKISFALLICTYNTL